MKTVAPIYVPVYWLEIEYCERGYPSWENWTEKWPLLPVLAGATARQSPGDSQKKELPYRSVMSFRFRC